MIRTEESDHMKKNGFMEEFKTFISRGNVVDMAVGVIVGAAFQKIVTSLVNDVIMPAVGLLMGGMDLAQHFLILKMPDGVTAAQVTTLEAAKELGVTTLNYGSFLASIVDFLILAFVVFMLVKNINKLRDMGKKPEEEPAPAAPTTKICPFCKSEIAIEASRCPHCTSQLEEETA